MLLHFGPRATLTARQLLAADPTLVREADYYLAERGPLTPEQFQGLVTGAEPGEGHLADITAELEGRILRSFGYGNEQ